MKRKIPFISFLLCAFACLIGTISNSISWFVEKAIVGEQSGLVGESQGAYFARGVGSSTEPFIINRPIHLYNLAWLQYIGYFNNNNAPFYFALDPADDIKVLDMDGWVLPPIGTSLYPFIGNFNGNGEVIQNLTIDNEISSGHIEKTPTFINTNSVDGNHILKVYQKGQTDKVSDGSYLNNTLDVVGFFGFLGTYSGMASVNADYASNNAVSAVALDGLTVKSSSSSALAGLVCGYDNAALSGVAVNGSSLYVASNATAVPGFTNKISDYSLVGYATDSALKKCFIRKDTSSLPKLNNPNTENGGQNWGGSIDMLKIYTQLAEIRDTHSATQYIGATEPFKYPTSETYYDDVLQTNLTESNVDNRRVTQSNKYYYYRYEGNQLKYDDSAIYASFSFVRETNSSYQTYVDGEGQTNKYNCLYGPKTYTSSYSGTNFSKTKYDYKATKTYYIKSGTHYLAASTEGITNPSPTSSGSARKWFIVDNRIFFQDNRTNYYLSSSSAGNLTISPTANAASQWSYDSTAGTYKNGNNLYLGYNEGWTTSTTTSISAGPYSISFNSGGTKYLTATTSGLGVSTSETKMWYFDGTGVSGRPYFVSENTNYYIQRYATVGTGTRRAMSVYNTSYLRYGDTTYLRYDNEWTYSDSYSATSFSFNPTTITCSSSSEESTSEWRYTGSSTAASSYTTYDTYFPLMMEPNTYKPMNEYIDPQDQGAQKKFNTGYIVSGANDTVSSAYQQVWGDIRVSAYPYSSLSNTTKIVTRTRYLSGTQSVDSGVKTMTSVNDAAAIKLQKFTSSYSKLQTLLTASQESGYVHGLHFMPAQISKSKLATIGRAVVLDGKTPQVQNENGVWEDRASVYDNYQVPQDSIDFNLKSHGYINFYAGAYFSGNNSFFSLHQIARNSNNAIDDIREISKVYCPNYTVNGNYLMGDADHPYIYQFSDNKWSSYSLVDGKWVSTPVTSEPSHGPLLFDCSWITAPGTLSASNGIYYYEIPVNAGEYALGSAAGKTGAYLLYLDIGAGAANYKDVELTETTVISITEISYLAGVDFVDLSIHQSDFATVVVGGSSASVAVAATNTAIAINYDFTTNTSTGKSVLSLTKAGNDPPNMASSIFDLKYKDEPVAANYLNNAISSSNTVTYTITMEKQTIQNYNPNVGTGTLTFTYVEKFTITNGVNQRKIQLPNTGGASAEWEKISGNASVTSGDSGGLVTFTGAGDAVIQSTWSSSQEIGEASNWTPLSSNNPDGLETSPIVEFHFIDKSVSTATPPNVVITYGYSGTKNDTTGNQDFVFTINVTNKSGKNIILVIDAIKLSFLTELSATYEVRLTYGSTTTNITTLGQEFVIPSIS